MLETIYQTATAVIHDAAMCKALACLARMPIGVECSEQVRVTAGGREYTITAYDIHAEFGGNALYLVQTSRDGADNAVIFFEDSVVGRAAFSGLRGMQGEQGDGAA